MFKSRLLQLQDGQFSLVEYISLSAMLLYASKLGDQQANLSASAESSIRSFLLISRSKYKCYQKCSSQEPRLESFLSRKCIILSTLSK